MEVRAELFREMGKIADDRALLEKVLAFVKSLVPTKRANSEIMELTDDERIDAALKLFHSDWGGDGDAIAISRDLRSNVEDSRTVEVW